MIELFHMQLERIEKLDLTEIQKTKNWLSPTRGIVWLRCTEPSQEDIKVLAELTTIPEDDLKGAIEENERSKVSVEKHIEIIFSVPVQEGNEIVTRPIYVYAIGNIVITAEKKPINTLNQLSFALLENKRKFLFKKPSGYFIFYVLDKMNGEFLFYIDKLSLKIEIFKDRGALSKQNIDRIYDTSLTLSYFNQSLIANIEVLNELRKSYFKIFEQEDREHFTELYYDALQILDTEKIQREVLSNLLNMQSIITSNELNQFMKVVAFVALFSTLPMLITSVFSMNIRHTPIVEGTYAFYIIIAILASSAIISYLLFKLFTKKWQ